MIKEDSVPNGREVNDNNSWYKKARSSFPEIDRDQEDKDVAEFQRTNDARLFEKVYKARIPTLKYWSKHHSYLMDSMDDMFGEFCLCFTKAVLTYKKRCGTFNTWLFTLLINCYQNLRIARKAQKRVPQGMDPNSFGRFMLSLDYSYDGSDSSENTLKDVLSSKMAVEDGTINKIVIGETTNIMSYNNPLIKGFLQRLSDGNTIASLLKEYKTRQGKIKISQSQIKRLHGKRRQKRMVTKLIREKTPHNEFSILDYSVKNPNKLYYTIELKKTKETDLMMKTIRRIRREKDNIISKISR